MKNLFKLLGVYLLVNILSSCAAPLQSTAQVNVSYQTFYDELQPYGRWVNDPDLGYVWVPDAGSDFQPYSTRGHWVVTQYGNTWVSDYSWGWAPFHYGRWNYSNYYGWTWIPGNEWGPAWVTWRTGGGYYGWAPMGPRVSISLSFGGGYRAPDNYWVFVPQQHICDRNINNYYIERQRNTTVINNTTIINNTYVNNNRTYITGPRTKEIEQVTRNRVRVYNVADNTQPGATVVDRGSVQLYRPTIQNKTGAVPTRVDNWQGGRRNNNNVTPGRDANGNPIVSPTNGRPVRDMNGNPVVQPRKDASPNPNTERTINLSPGRDANGNLIVAPNNGRPNGNTNMPPVNGRPNRDMNGNPTTQPGRDANGNPVVSPNNGRPTRDPYGNPNMARPNVNRDIPNRGNEQRPVDRGYPVRQGGNVQPNNPRPTQPVRPNGNGAPRPNDQHQAPRNVQPQHQVPARSTRPAKEVRRPEQERPKERSDR